MPNYSRKIVYLSEAQKAELFTNHTITVNGTTITYNENDLYVTPQEQPYIKPSNGIPASDLAAGVVNVNDVQINNISIISNGIADIPMASTSQYGVVKVGAGLMIYNNALLTNPASTSVIKSATAQNLPITPFRQHESVFYGLAKAAGDNTQASSSNLIGAYTPEAKAAIQNMLGITDLLSTEESSTATTAHAVNSTFMMDGKLHRATAAIAIGDAVEVGTNCEVVKIDEVFVRNDYKAQNPGVEGAHGPLGLVCVNPDQGISVNDSTGTLRIQSANSDLIKEGVNARKPITPIKQHESVFYGLSKVAGVDLANETVTLGRYPGTARIAIRKMIDALGTNNISAGLNLDIDAETENWILAADVQDIQINGTSIVNNGVANIPLASSDGFGVVKAHYSYGVGIDSNTKNLIITQASESIIKAATNNYYPIVPSKQHIAIFYGLSKLAGIDLANETVTVGTYPETSKIAIRSLIGAAAVSDIPSVPVQDVQVNGTSVVSNGVANIPLASQNNLGISRPNAYGGITINDAGQLNIACATVAEIKTGTNAYKPLTPNYQHHSVFYGLAKAAGDSTQAASDNAVGIYTTEAKAAIHTMLGIDPASIAAQVDIPLVETVSGTTPTITGQPNVRYVCGEVSTISITPPASGSVDVIFESGSTATTMTVPSTVKWPAWFDVETLEANTTYEVLITDGIYGSVMTWAT